MKRLTRALSVVLVGMTFLNYLVTPSEAAVTAKISVDAHFANHAVEGQIVSENLSASPPQVKIMVTNPHQFWTNVYSDPHFASNVKPADWSHGGVDVGGIYAQAGVLIGGGEAVWDWQFDVTKVRSTGVSIYVSPALSSPNHTFTPAAGVLNVLSILAKLIGQTPQWRNTPEILDIVSKLETSQTIIDASHAIDQQDPVQFAQDFYKILNDPQDVQTLKDALAMVGIQVSASFLKTFGELWTIGQLVSLTSDIIFATVRGQTVGSIDFAADRPFDLGLIAYTGGDGNIWIINLDGSSPRQVTESGSADRPLSSPRWSGDGSLLAFALGPTSQGSPITTFGVVELATASARLVQPDKPVSAPFAFFPDGKHLVAVSRAPADVGFCANQVVSIDLASGAVSPLANGGCRIWSLQVTPDSQSLLITSGGSDPVLKVLKVPILSGPVATVPTLDSSTGARPISATLSSDGARLAYLFSGTDPTSAQSLVLAERDGSQPTSVYRVPNGVHGSDLSFSPTHEQLAFGLQGNQLPQSEIWVVGLNGTGAQRIGVGSQPSWQPVPFTLKGSLPVSLPIPKGRAIPAAPATRVIVFHPVGVRPGPAASGDCWTRSIQLDGADAWRCHGSSGIEDPCFSAGPDPKEVICQADPTTDGRGSRLVLTSPLPLNEPLHKTSPLDVFVVQLADGTVCWFSNAGPLLIADTIQFVRNSCGKPVSQNPLMLWALVNIKPGSVWTADKVELAPSSGGGFKVIQRQSVTLTTVWK